MKKFVAVMAAALLIVLCTGTAFAHGDTYSLPDLNLTVAIPDGYLVVTDETLDDLDVKEALYDLFGLEAREARTSLADQDIYLDALEADGKNEFMISMTQDEEDGATSVMSTNFAQMLIEDMQDVEGYVDQQVEYFKSEAFAEEVGGEVVGVEKVQTDDALYISYHIIVEVDGAAYDELHYMTIKNGQHLDFMLRENNGSITPEHEELMEGIMDSVEIGKAEDNAVTRKIAQNERASVTGVVVGIVLAAVVALGAYLRYRSRRNAEQAQVNRMADIERDSFLKANAAEQVKYLIGRLTVMRDEGVITQEEYDRKVEEIGKRNL